MTNTDALTTDRERRERASQLEAAAREVVRWEPKARAALNRLPHFSPDQYIEDRNAVRAFDRALDSLRAAVAE